MRHRTRTIRTLLITLAVVCPLVLTAPVAVTLPAISAEVTGPGKTFESLMELKPTDDMAHFGYTAHEFFVSGTANGQPYKTRIVIRRPSNPARFSGLRAQPPQGQAGRRRPRPHPHCGRSTHSPAGCPPRSVHQPPPGSAGARLAAGAAGGGKGRLIFLYSALPMQTWIDGMGHRINGKW